MLFFVHWWRFRRYPEEKRKSMVEHAVRVKDSPDFDAIPKHPKAGRLSGMRLVMHNGLKVLPTAYYGWQFLARSRVTQTVDEPQEERVFGDLLPLLDEGSVMLELGSFWAFYSLWFHSRVANGVNHMIEPEYKNMLYGVTNFESNGFHTNAFFTHAFVDAAPGVINGVRVISVDEYCRENGIERLTVLHSDIQGYESNMLDGAREMLEEKRIDYVFISSHSNELHAECMEKLACFGYVIVTEANLDEAYQADGFIFASLPGLPGTGIRPAAKKPAASQPSLPA